jgi:hypothetical protein
MMQKSRRAVKSGFVLREGREVCEGNLLPSRSSRDISELET